MLKTFVKKFKGSELDKSGVKVSMFESGAMEGQGSTAMAYMDCILGKGPKYVFKNAALRKYFDEVSMHSYWSDTDTKKATADYISEKYSKFLPHNGLLLIFNPGPSRIFTSILAASSPRACPISSPRS